MTGASQSTGLRSLLVAPANRGDLIGKVSRPGADGAVIDLEDGTPPSQKVSARATARAGIAALVEAGERHPRLFLRTNSPDSELFEGDLACACETGPGLEGVVVPKIESAQQVVAIERRLFALEREAGKAPHSLLIGIETVAGVAAAAAIASASTRACGLYFGAEDFIADIGGQRSAAGDEVAYARSRAVLAARAAGIEAVDQAVVEVRDDERFVADARCGARLGYGGKTCLTPRQVELANAVFTPSAEEVAWSNGVLGAYQAAMEQGNGIAEFEGQMIDAPLVRRAHALLQRGPGEDGALPVQSRNTTANPNR